ncbi:MAG: CRISPR-associated endonuclease Cas6 [Bacteroidota bacterium]
MTQKSIPITTVTFDQPIHPGQLRRIRGAIIESVMSFKPIFEIANVVTEVFHNHLEKVAVPALPEEVETPQTGADRYYHYPLIQYQVRHKKAGITGIGRGAQALQLWLSLVGDEITAEGKPLSLTVHQHQHLHWIPALLDEVTTYRINKWLPFNPKNYDLWRSTARLTEKVKLLDKLIWGHLFHLAEGLNIHLNKEALQVYVSTIDMQTFKDCYNIKKLALDITFCTNLNLPGEIGLGQGTTIGFGEVQKIANKRKS